ncbi:glycerol-3-phosphate acyltransferase [Planococcus shenhongbingii]|uniref:Glycerol-3-phosphate acyltransferase n=1 Tax=Planococcus shenhongbingii TaxID=3058398 RepID=A0ABT8NAD1_9BACL|nr:glycerol-3-phosphate acyltransferase [Planococcus sp. N017]MDN7244844.1 glycerol-3-phosphate acyltransferase [Planococcus sp. N017]
MVIYWIASYFIGNLLTAWWIGKWKGIDLRKERSGNLGARNAGAVIGKTAFVLTFLGDAAKGALVVGLGHYGGFNEWVIAIGGLLVICGHLFPLWLKGRGGKGIATFIGVSLLTTPSLFLVMFLVFGTFFPILKSATLTMLTSFSAFIIAVSLTGQLSVLWPLILAIILILIKHQNDLRESFEKRFAKL